MKEKLTRFDWQLMIDQEIYVGYRKKRTILLGTVPYPEIDDDAFMLRDCGLEESPEDCKPILRTYNMMSEEEQDEFRKLDVCDSCQKCEVNQVFSVCLRYVNQSNFLDRIGIDQRDWIGQGLAIKKEDNKK